MLFAVQGDALREQRPMQFSDLGWHERRDLQRLVRANPAVLGEDLLIIAEEFGDWQGAKRRIDLLALDRAGQLVVIELKRTDDGGHMELQALRYAAMVSAMTFDQAVDNYSRLHATDRESDSRGRDSRAVIAEFIGRSDEESSIEISSKVRIILVSRNFSVEITTTVLWLNNFYATDIKCIRMTPYKLEGGTEYLDVQQVIPLPEAQDYQVKIREKEASRERSEIASGGNDNTQYRIVVDGRASAPLNKREAALAMVKALKEAGVPYEEIARIFPTNKLRGFDEIIVDPDQLLQKIRSETLMIDPEIRFFYKEPLVDTQLKQTWVLSNQWKREGLEATFRKVVEAYGDKGISYQAVTDGE